MRRAAWRPELGILFGCVLLLSLAWLHVAFSADGGLRRSFASDARAWVGLRVVFSRGGGGDAAARRVRDTARRHGEVAAVGLQSPLYQPEAGVDGGGVNVTRVYFFAIVTQPLQFRRRRIIRSTWLHCLRADAAQRGASGLPLRVELRYRFFIAGDWPPEMRREAGRTRGHARLAAEMARYRDIVPLAVTERYENLTRKSQAMLQWVAREWAAEAEAAAGDAAADAHSVLLPAPLAPGGLECLRQLRAYPNGSSFLSYLLPDGEEAAAAGQLHPSQFEAVDADLASNLSAALGGGDSGVDTDDDDVGGSGPGRPWGAPFAGVHAAAPGRRGVLEFLVKTDSDVHYCPGNVLRYGPALLALHSGAAGLTKWRIKDQPPEVTAAQMAAVHTPGAAPQYLWAGKGPYGNRTIIRDPKNYYHLPPQAYPGPVEPPFVPGPSYMLSGPLLLALAGAFPGLPPQGALDPWRGFEDRYLGMQVEHLARVRGVPVRVLGRDDHYMDFATSAALLKSYAPPRPFCERGWVPKLGAQVIGYNESAPLHQFACPGWAWPGEGDDDPPLAAVPVDAAAAPAPGAAAGAAAG